MNRRAALTYLGSTVILAGAAALFGRFKMTATTEKMPVLFLGHGSPMNALANNSVTQAFAQLGKTLPAPKAILVISAHWMTRGTWVTHMDQPKTIHDFYGFPQALFNVQYPAPGSPALADDIQKLVLDPQIGADDNEWGLDHGTWSVLKHVYPKADIPVVQLSLDMTKPAEYHFELGKKLQALRHQGVLILGSGNVVHNLRRISWEEQAKPFDWSVEFDEWIKAKSMDRDFKSIVSHATDTEAGKLSIPTPDHYYPLMYILGASDAKDQLHFDIEGIQNASISMRSFRFG